MTVVFIVLPVALAIALVAILAFVWAVRNGQMDDLDTPALRILHEDQATEPTRADRDDEPSTSATPPPDRAP